MDYYNGKPLKLDWKKKPGGHLIANSVPYDIAHGKFRFFEALLNVFDPDEIFIMQKEYNTVTDKLYFNKDETRIIEYELMQILENTFPINDNMGIYWKIDTNNIRYRSSFLNGLDI